MGADRVVLVGARGAGKSTVGPLLAARLGVPFLDTDAEVERSCGRTIARLLADGSFRAAETRVLEVALGSRRAVVAAGGGAVLWPGFAGAVAAWRVVWLDAPGDVLSDRIRGSDRPSLTGRSPAEEVGEIAAARAPLYAACASLRVDTGGLRPDQVATRIEKLLRIDEQAGSCGAD